MLFDVSSFIDSFSAPRKSTEDIMEEKRRKAWHQENKSVPRCDFRPSRARLNSRGIMFLSLWSRSLYGMTLDEIKADPAMPLRFADEIAPFIRRVLGPALASGDWAIVTPPPRRHPEANFAQAAAALISGSLGIPFRPRFAKARTRQRIGAEFDIVEIPPESNIIVFDDICTTGSTFIAMEAILSRIGKNRIYFAGINNH